MTRPVHEMQPRSDPTAQGSAHRQLPRLLRLSLNLGSSGHSDPAIAFL